MKIMRFVILALFIFVIAGVTHAGRIEIKTKGKVTLGEKTITIADISTVTGDNPELVNKINNIEIGRTPWPNNRRRIDTDFLKMRLRILDIKLSDIVFNGAKIVTVSVESTKISGNEIAEKAREHLLSVLPLDGRETAVELQRIPGDQWISRKREEVVLDASLVDLSRDRGNVGVIVSAVSVDGIPYFKTSVFFKVRVFEYVAISKRKISRHQPLDEDNVFFGRRETTRARGMAFYRAKDLTGKTAIRTIIPNTIITEDIVETPPTVLKGNLVKMFIKTDGFSIVTKGLAQETGYTGKIIRIKSVDSKKILHGKIIDSENVQIVF